MISRSNSTLAFATILAYLSMAGPYAVADDSQIEFLLDSMAAEFENATHKGSGKKLDDSLIAKGLAQSDSEKIVQDFARASAKCVLDGIQTYSERRSINFDDELDQLVSAVKDESLGNYLSALDQDEFGSIVTPCIFDAGEAAGLNVG